MDWIAGYEADRFLSSLESAERMVDDAVREGVRLDDASTFGRLRNQLLHTACEGDERLLEAVLQRLADFEESIERRSPLFLAGPRLEITNSAERLLENSRTDLFDLLRRHMRGDWGVVDLKTAALNESRLRLGDKVVTRYVLGSAGHVAGITLCVLTYPAWELTQLMTLEEERLGVLEEPLPMS